MRDNMDTITVILAALLTARLTRLITRDKLTEPLRNQALLHLDEDGAAAYLITCDWCASFYVGGAVAAGGAWAGLWSWWWAPVLAFVFSHVAGFLASREGE